MKTTSKIWFITGASRGLGADLTAAVLAQGDIVVATARDPKTIPGESDRLHKLALDVTNPISIATAMETAIAKLGRIDVLVNNAGYGILGAVEETTSAEVRKVYETNVFGLLDVTRAALPHLRRQRAGHIINISSVGGYRSFPGFGVYCSTKFAVEALSEALHAELAPLGVHVTVVEPGYFRTDFLKDTSIKVMPGELADYATTSGATREHAKNVNGSQPGDPKKLARVLAELAHAKTPPLRLPLGTDTVAAIESKNAFVAEELQAWRAVAVSTDFS